MVKFIKPLLRKWIGAICISILAISCAPEEDVEIVDSELRGVFDAKLEEVLEIMGDTPELAIEQLDNIIQESEATHSKFYSGKAKWYKAYIYDDILEDVSLAYQNYNEALKDVLQTDDSSLKMKLYNNLGVLYEFYGQYDAAINNYKSAFDLKDDLTDKQLSNLYYNYGVALKLKGDDLSSNEAEQAFTQALEYAKKIDYHENIADVHNQIGMMYKDMKNYDIARIAYNNTIRTYIENEELHHNVGLAYHGIGVTYMEEGNTEEAIRAFNKALEYKKYSGSIFITKYDLGTLLMDDGRSDEAIAVWKDALSEKHNKNSIEQVKIYADLTSALEMNNKYEEALSYSQIFNSSVQNILIEEEEYKAENDRVIFANIIKEYEEFNRPVPYFQRPVVIISTLLGSILLVYLFSFIYYRSKFRRKVSDTVSEIQSEFLHIKVD